ncbi:MAG TPA: arylsulfotransferase family protein, partial [Kiloniellaceae bacterium]
MHSRTPPGELPPAAESPPSSALLDRLSFAGFVLAVLFLCFIGGALVILTDVFPAQAMKDAYRGGKAYVDKMKMSENPLASDFWQPERRPDKGVTLNTPDAYPGYTLYTSGHASEASLISLDGKVLHRWQLSFSAVWNETSPVKEPMPDNFFYWRKARLLPDGGLLAIFVVTGDTPWGYGMVKLDKDSNVIWSYLGQTHHDFDMGADGRIYALTHEMRRTTYERHPQLTVPRLDDFVVVLSPEGEELKKVSILDALAGSKYGWLLNRVVWYNKHDFIHTNNIDVLEGEEAAALSFAEDGQVLLSFRDIDTIALLDLESEKIVWTMRGGWIGQHDPDVLANGNILLYDNLGGFEQSGRTRILEVDPDNGGVVWRYAGSLEQPFESEARGAQ